MARINYSPAFNDNVTLFKALLAKHVADGGASVLTPFLTAESINLTADNLKVNEAMNAHGFFQQAERDSEKFTNERKRLFDPCVSDHKRCVQFIKTFNRSNISALGDWGVTVTNNSRIEYPSDFTELSTALINFIEKHDSYAAGTSPLQPFLDLHQIDLGDNLADINDAITANNNYNTSFSYSVNQSSERDTLFDPVMVHVRECGNFLVTLFDTNPRKAGDWGYNIDDSPQGTKQRVIIIPKGGVKTIYKCVKDSIMSNTGTVPLDIFPGKGTTGTPVTVAAGGNLKLVRGFAKITARNNSLTVNGEITVTVKK